MLWLFASVCLFVQTLQAPFDVGWSNLTDTFSNVGINKFTRFFFLFKCQYQISKAVDFASEYLNWRNKGELNNQLKKCIYFITWYHHQTSIPLNSVLSPHSHSSVNPFFLTPLFSPYSPSHHSIHPALHHTTFTPHSPSHHSPSVY